MDVTGIGCGMFHELPPEAERKSAMAAAYSVLRREINEAQRATELEMAKAITEIIVKLETANAEHTTASALDELLQTVRNAALFREEPPAEPAGKRKKKEKLPLGGLGIGVLGK